MATITADIANKFRCCSRCGCESGRSNGSCFCRGRRCLPAVQKWKANSFPYRQSVSIREIRGSLKAVEVFDAGPGVENHYALADVDLSGRAKFFKRRKT